MPEERSAVALGRTEPPRERALREARWGPWRVGRWRCASREGPNIMRVHDEGRRAGRLRALLGIEAHLGGIEACAGEDSGPIRRGHWRVRPAARLQPAQGELVPAPPEVTVGDKDSCGKMR